VRKEKREKRKEKREKRKEKREKRKEKRKVFFKKKKKRSPGSTYPASPVNSPVAAPTPEIAMPASN
jgi:hypothetical protein